MKFRKKPVVIEAVRWAGKNRKEINKFCGNKAIILPTKLRSDGLIIAYDLLISTLEGVMHASVGDYIIKGVNGEFYPCKAHIFEETYEAVEE